MISEFCFSISDEETEDVYCLLNGRKLVKLDLRFWSLNPCKLSLIELSFLVYLNLCFKQRSLSFSLTVTDVIEGDSRPLYILVSNAVQVLSCAR